MMALVIATNVFVLNQTKAIVVIQWKVKYAITLIT